jgi:hypothetical protein
MGQWQMANGKWKMEEARDRGGRALFPFAISHLPFAISSYAVAR